jgi:hypothetical protein
MFRFYPVAARYKLNRRQREHGKRIDPVSEVGEAVLDESGAAAADADVRADEQLRLL